jgi:hypothetical protein
VPRAEWGLVRTGPRPTGPSALRGRRAHTHLPCRRAGRRWRRPAHAVLEQARRVGGLAEEHAGEHERRQGQPSPPPAPSRPPDVFRPCQQSTHHHARQQQPDERQHPIDVRVLARDLGHHPSESRCPCETADRTEDEHRDQALVPAPGADAGQDCAAAAPQTSRWRVSRRVGLPLGEADHHEDAQQEDEEHREEEATEVGRGP